MIKKVIYVLTIFMLVIGIYNTSVIYGVEGDEVSDEEVTVEETMNNLGDGFDSSIITNLGNGEDDFVEQLDGILYKIWNTFKVCVWVLSFVGIFAAGLRYIFAGIDEKADLKKGLGKLVLGIIIVDATSLIIDIIIKIFYEII